MRSAMMRGDANNVKHKGPYRWQEGICRRRSRVYAITTFTTTIAARVTQNEIQCPATREPSETVPVLPQFQHMQTQG
jgi:hypothetical protein